MALFPKETQIEIPFNKEEILESLENIVTLDYPQWKFIRFNGYPCDVLLIKSIEILESYVNKANPFSEYSSLKKNIYQIVIGVDVISPDALNLPEKDHHFMKHYIITDSVKPVIRTIKQY